MNFEIFTPPLFLRKQIMSWTNSIGISMAQMSEIFKLNSCALEHNGAKVFNKLLL